MLINSIDYDKISTYDILCNAYVERRIIMKLSIFKKAISVFLAVLMAFSVSVVAFAAETECEKSDTFSLSVHTERDSYQKGEEIKFICEIRNRTELEYENLAVVADVPRSDTYLSRGSSEAMLSYIAPGDSLACEFRFSEYEAVAKIGDFISKLGALPQRVFRFFVRHYNTAASLFLTAKMVMESSFKDSFSHMFTLRESQSLEKCKVLYDGKGYEFGFHVTYEKKIKQENAKAEKLAEGFDKTEINAALCENSDRYSAVIFGSQINENGFDGYAFYINPQHSSAGVLLSENGEMKLLAEKKVAMEKGKEYSAKIIYTFDRAVVYLYNNKKDGEPYPLFDIPFSKKGSDIGAYALSTSLVSINEVKEADVTEYAETYTNPVMQDGADPYVLFHDGVYYMYITNGYSWNGFEVYTSENLVDWEYGGVVAKKGDIIGGSNFWAAEVYYYNNQFYMFYSADEKSAVAVSDSPFGPFKKTSDDFLFDFSAIDGSLLFDDDGRIYLFFSRIRHSEGEGQQIWGCEMNSDLISVKPETLTLVSAPDKAWDGWVNEGPFVLKHNGTYYLTYSGDFYFNRNYAVGYATSSSPLGEYVKYKNNPVLKSDTFIHGTGHHCFTQSPDGSEMFIVYHCHNSAYKVHDRKICIDRVKFTETENGIDVLTVYGPTVTAQPMPK